MDDYMACPACGSMMIYRDLMDCINSCHDCGFTHHTDVQTTEEAVQAHVEWLRQQSKED